MNLGSCKAINTCSYTFLLLGLMELLHISSTSKTLHCLSKLRQLRFCTTVYLKITARLIRPISSMCVTTRYEGRTYSYFCHFNFSCSLILPLFIVVNNEWNSLLYYKF